MINSRTVMLPAIVAENSDPET